jgi:hypothetical protein
MYTPEDFIGYSITDGIKLAYNALKTKADIAMTSGGFCQYSDYAQDWARLSTFIADEIYIGSPDFRSIQFPFSWTYMQYSNGTGEYYSSGHLLTRNSTSSINPASLLMRAVWGVTEQFSIPSRQETESAFKSDVSRPSLSSMWNECFPGTSSQIITDTHYIFDNATEKYLDLSKYYKNVICDVFNYMDACSAVIKAKNVWDPPHEGGQWRFYAETINE